MDFGAVVAYCKGWYERSANKLDWWKDLMYCISADGYTIFDKSDVIQWILNRFSQNEEWFKKINNSFGIGWFYREMQQQKRYWSCTYEDELSEDDALIFVFMGIVNISDTKLFDTIYKPTEKVLPLSKNGLISVDEMFKDCAEQELSHYDREYIANKPCMLN